MVMVDPPLVVFSNSACREHTCILCAPSRRRPLPNGTADCARRCHNTTNAHLSAISNISQTSTMPLCQNVPGAGIAEREGTKHTVNTQTATQPNPSPLIPSLPLKGTLTGQHSS